MKPLKKPRQAERDVATRGNHKKATRPWRLEYQWESQQAWDKGGFLKGDKYTDGWYHRFNKYTDPDHAEKQLNKDLRTRFSWFARAAGKNWRIHNKETGEKVYIEIRDNQVQLRGDTNEILHSARS